MEAIKTLEEREKELIELGKKEGFITYEQLAEKLKGLEIDADSLDELYNLLIARFFDLERASDIYKKIGFKEVSIRKNYYGEDDGILMEKKLI